jgi:hypothetical protein
MEDSMTGLGPEANALLEAARFGDEPTRADQDRVRAAVAIRLAGGAAAGLGVAAATKGSAALAVPGGLATKVLVVAAFVGAMGASALIATRISRPSAAPASFQAGPPRTSTGALERPNDDPTDEWWKAIAIPAAPAAPGPEERASGPHRSSRTPAGRVVAPSATSSGRATPGSSDVAAEVRLLGEAQTAIRGGDAERALLLLDEHARRYPNGALGEERDAARIAALCALGRVGEAKDAADRFLRVAPLSPHAGPVRASCGGFPATSAPQL